MAAHLFHKHVLSQIPLLNAVGQVFACTAGGIPGCIGFSAHSAYAQTGSFQTALKAGAFAGITAAAFNAVGAGPFGYGVGDGPAQLALNALASGVVGGVLHELQGGKFGHGFFSAAAMQAAAGRIDGLKRRYQRTLAAAALGGTVSAATGGKFANGAITAAFSRAVSERGTMLSSSDTSAQKTNRRDLRRELNELRQNGTLDTSREFGTADEAAQEVLSATALLSAKYNLEVGGNILQTGDGQFRYTFPTIGTRSSVRVYPGATGYHTHPSGQLVFSNRYNQANPTDHGYDALWVKNARRNLYLGVAAPSGVVQIGICEYRKCFDVGRSGTEPSRVIQR